MIEAVEKRLRHVFSVTSGATPDSGNADYWDGDILWATPEDISSLDSYWLRDTRRKITLAGYESCGTTTAPAGSIVLTKRAPIGQVAVLAEAASSNQGCFLLTPRTDTDTRFFYYWLLVQTAYLQALGRGSTFMELSTDELKSLNVPHPSLLQQSAIADYLDRETARLDALVAAKERVLGLLAEKRRALITRAVTRGLDPRAPLRDSGIPWLGEIPAHWGTRMLRFACQAIQTGGTPSQEFLDDSTENTVNWFTPGDFSEGLELRDSARRISSAAVDAGDARLFPAGTVFVVGIGATLGKVGLISAPSSANQQVNALILRPEVESACVAYLLTLLGELMNTWANSATLPILNQQRMGEIPVPVPPSEEQRAIVAHIAKETEKLDELRVATERTTVLLKERRAALIAAAVTGQIKHF